MPPRDATFIMPIGTQVVLRVPAAAADTRALHPAGSVAIVTRAPSDHTHPYRVRFADGSEAMIRRVDLAVLKDVQRVAPRELDALREHDLFDCVMYRCVVGSRAYGLDDADSDVDLRGVYLPPANLHWSLYGAPEQLENPQSEECYWELQKFLVLALKANPNVLECLYTPLVTHTTTPADELLAMRGAFLSKLVYQTYNGYVLSQFRKLDADLRNHGQIKWKHVMHLIRLLQAGVTALRAGHVPVRVEQHRERLLAIRRGETPWDDVNAWRLDLHRAFEDAYAATRLPERPDYARVNDFLIRARRSAVEPRGGPAAQARPSAPGPAAASCRARDATAEPPSALTAESPGFGPILAAQPYPLLFATISGAHLYGFPSPDSDYDLRGVHVLPIGEVVGLDTGPETLEQSGRAAVAGGAIELDLVTHDVRKFFRMLLQRNGYVLEQLYSPLIVQTTPEHAELKDIARGCLTRQHAHHYLGFAASQWALVLKAPRVKPLLYVYRVLLTGIHLMRAQAVEANLRVLNERFCLPQVADLMARKQAGPERQPLGADELALHEAEYRRLTTELEAARDASALPAEATARGALHGLLLRVRRATIGADAGGW